MARRILTEEEQEQRNIIKAAAAASGIPFTTLNDWANKDDSDYRQFIYFMFVTLGTEKTEELKKQFEKHIKTPKEKRNFNQK